MIQTRRPTRQAASALLLLLILFIALIPQTSWATQQVREETIKLTGTSSGQFELNSSDSELFALTGMLPGDSWTGKLNVVNETDGKMYLSLISITSNIEDELLFDALDLKILLDGGLLYEGSYGATRTPILEMLPVEADKSVEFEITVSLPTTAGNELQAKKMDSTWLFEANYEPGSNVQTGVDLTVGNTGNATWLIVTGLCLACAVILFFRVKTAKREVEQMNSMNEEETTYEE